MNIRNIYEELLKAESLKPSPYIDKLFISLDEIIFSGSDSNIDLNTNEIENLQKIYSKGEYEFECFWAQKIIDGTDPKEILYKYPHFKNYTNFVNTEWSSFKTCVHHNNHSVIFCGGGPLPSTAIVLALEHNVSSTIIDNNQKAVRLARKVIKSLNLERMIDIKYADATNFSDFGLYNTIFVAALVGLTDKAKEEVFENIRSQILKGTHIIARSSCGNGKILYRPLPDRVRDEFILVGKILPNSNFVISVEILKKD